MYVVAEVSRLKHKEAVAMISKVMANIEVEKLFAEPYGTNVTSVAAMKETLARYALNVEGADSGNRLMMKARDNDRQIVNAQFKSIADFYDAATGHDVAVLSKLGFQIKKTQKTTSTYIVMVAAMINALVHGKDHGTFMMKVACLKGAGAYDIEFCEGYPTSEESWKHCTAVKLCNNILLSGFTPGQVYTFRVRGIFAKGYGPWSDYKTLMCI